MKKINNETITKISISVALAAVLVSGCGSSHKSSKDSTVPQNTEKTQDKKAGAQKSAVKTGINAITGTIDLDNTPAEGRDTKSLSLQTLSSSMYAITAYNLDNKSVYKTTTDARGVYTLSGMSDGRYQVYAKNDAVSKSSIKRVTLSRGTRAVVDFTLQAAGSIKGKIEGASMVFIPGKDFISFADSDGNFELTNIPVGTYTLKYEVDDKDYYDFYGEVEITVKTGMSDLGEIKPSKNIELDTELKYGVLGLHQSGISFYSQVNIDSAEFKKSVKLTDSSGKNIEIEVFNGYGNRQDKPLALSVKSVRNYYGYRSGLIKSKEIVSAGNYTLTIPASVSEDLIKDIVKTFHVDALSIASANYDSSVGSRYLSLTLPKDLTTIEQATLSSLKVKEKGLTEEMVIKPSWTDANRVILFGNYKNGAEYTFVLTDEQKALVGSIKKSYSKLSFDKSELTEIYPSDTSKNVRLNQKLYVSVRNISELDTSSVKITLNDGIKDISIDNKDILIKEESHNYYYDYNSEDYRYYRSNTISFQNVKLEYGKNYTMKVEAKDIYGSTLMKESSFTTLTPAVSSLSPNSVEDLFKDNLSASFNVEIQKDAGSISIEDLTDSGTVAMINVHELSSIDSVSFDIEGLTPDHRYKITASGFKSIDAIDIPEKSSEFSAPPRMLFVDNMYKQNLNVTAEQFKHKVEFSVFGKLTDTEKQFMQDHLKVTSYGKLNTSDETHPTRKLFFKEEGDSTHVTVAFTIDAGTNYELSFSDVSGLKDIVMPRGFEANMPLVSFSTKKSVQVDNISDYKKIIRDMQLSNNGTKGNLSLDLKLPLGTISSSESCWKRFNVTDDIKNDIRSKIKLTTEDDTSIPIIFSSNNDWYIHSDYISNNQQICLVSPHINASFKSDYDTKYVSNVDFSGNEYDTYGYGALKLSKQITTDEIGKLNYWLDNNGGENELVFHVDANAPFTNPDVFKVMMDGTEYSRSVGMGNTSSVIFKLPRPLYSVAEFTLSKNAGSVVSFYDKNETVEKANVLATPKTFTESVSPDFIPVKVEKVHTSSVKNDTVIVDFNRAVNMSDVVTYDATKAISDLAFEVKDTDGTAVTIANVSQENNHVMFKLSKELNTTKEYTISLKDGKTIRSAFGVQKLTTFSDTISPTIIEITDKYVVHHYGIVDNKNNPYELGSTTRFDDTESSYKVVIDVDTVTNATIDLSSSKIGVNSKNSGDLVLAGNNLIQKLNGYYYNESIDAHVSYNYRGKSFFIDKYFSNLRSIDTVSVYSIEGSGTDSMDFDFSSTKDAISKENFKVYTEEGVLVKSAISNVQLQNTYNSDVTVTFQNLTADTTYRVDVEGISSDGDKIGSTVPVAQVYIKTLAN